MKIFLTGATGFVGHHVARALAADGAKLRLVAWRLRGTAYWVSNTLDDELSNAVMLSLATSSARVR